MFFFYCMGFMILIPLGRLDPSRFRDLLDDQSDELGHVPLMFGLENDDPRVEDVFGPDYAHRLQERLRRR